MLSQLPETHQSGFAFIIQMNKLQLCLIPKIVGELKYNNLLCKNCRINPKYRHLSKFQVQLQVELFFYLIIRTNRILI